MVVGYAWPFGTAGAVFVAAALAATALVRRVPSGLTGPHTAEALRPFEPGLEGDRGL
ncbi:MAG: hypothetical protein ACR2L8_11785 [Solirubrobacteraceae bacterium]